MDDDEDLQLSDDAAAGAVTWEADVVGAHEAEVDGAHVSTLADEPQESTLVEAAAEADEDAL
jgi:hypothetical protein